MAEKKGIIKKIKSALAPTEEEKYLKLLNDFIESEVPKEYNQLKLLQELANPEIDHFISISNRTDGKSINYIHALIHIAINFDLGLFFFSRNMMLRISYQDLIEEIINISNIYERKDFNFIRNQYYVSLVYKGKPIAVISSLNDASELKYFSNFIKNFPIMIFDEFLALQSEYLSDEFIRIKTIYESIDRIETYPLIKKPKIFYLGNAVNFESPVLHGLKIFNILEKHEMNTAKVYHYDYHVMLEMHKNENANTKRNTRAFDSEDDAMSTGTFEKNDFNIANKSEKNHVKKNPRFIYVKLQKDYLKIWFNRDDLTTILSIESRIDEDYHYNLLLKDNKENSIYLTQKYFDDNHIKKIDNGFYLFDNNFSKNAITTDYININRLKINKLMREFLLNDTEIKESESKEKQFEDNYLEQTKRNLFLKMMG